MSSKTRSPLRANARDIVSPWQSVIRSKRFWGGLLLTVVMLLLLVKLSLWQFDRGLQKQRLEAQLLLRSEQTPKRLQDIDFKMPIQMIDVIGTPVQFDVEKQSQHIILLDNQIHNGVAGYSVFQLMKPTQSINWILVELGYIHQGLDRQQKPNITLQSFKQIEGKLYTPVSNPLSQQLMLEWGEVNDSGIKIYRIQNMNVEQLSQALKLPLISVYLTINPTTPTHYQPLDKSLPMLASKHFGYAFQWIVMAVVLLSLSLFCLRRYWLMIRIQQGSHDG